MLHSSSSTPSLPRVCNEYTGVRRMAGHSRNPALTSGCHSQARTPPQIGSHESRPPDESIGASIGDRHTRTFDSRRGGSGTTPVVGTSELSLPAARSVMLRPFWLTSATGHERASSYSHQLMSQGHLHGLTPRGCGFGWATLRPQRAPDTASTGLPEAGPPPWSSAHPAR